MGRHLLAGVVVVVDTALLAFGPRAGLSNWVVLAYALAVTLVIALRYRSATAAFVAALLLAWLTDAGHILLLWAAYQAGREVVSRSGTAVIVGAALGFLGVPVVTRLADPRAIPNLAFTYVVLVALPLLAGRYLAQHGRLVSALDQRNRQLRRERELLAEQERLRERLRIARDMHDSLGHRLSLVSIQAAALEVSALPPQQRSAVQQLAAATRGAMNELYELVGALRGEAGTPARSPGVEAIAALVAEFRAAGAPVVLHRRGQPRGLSTAVGQAAYRVVEEGLTNAAKHAPGRPVTVRVEWEADALLLTVVNALPEDPAGTVGSRAGHGLSGLRERVRPVGGLLDCQLSGGQFRLLAMLPALSDAAVDEADVPAGGRIRMVALGFATAVLMFVILPASVLLGVPGR